MKNMKKISLSLIGALTAATPFATTISCFSNSWKTLGYDFGIAIPPINTLNYVKYNSLHSIVPTLLQGLLLKGPGATLKNQLQLPDFTFSNMENINQNLSTLEQPQFNGLQSKRFYRLADNNFFAGNTKIGATGLAFHRNSSDYIDYAAISLNGTQKWKGENKQFNRVIEAQDYIDYVKYCTDINVGSMKIVNFEYAKIYGLNEFIEAQREYVKEFGKTYNNPWGKNVEITPSSQLSDFVGAIGNDAWPSQNSNDAQYVQKIRESALKFLLGGMRTSSKSVMHKSNDKNMKDVDTSKTDLFIRFHNSTSSPFSMLQLFLMRLLPINKEFVDYIGGIENFGISLNKWQYSSPFNITDISLGQGGFIDLEKDKSWNTSSYTMSDKIKIYFNSEPNVLSALFEDKYISATTIPGIYQTKFWSDPSIRQYMFKQNGIGTQALQLNLDKEKNANSPLLNENFRNAIAHAIDRERLIKLLNWDASFPISTWTPLGGVIAAPDGKIIDDFLRAEKLQGPYDSSPYSLVTSSWINNSAKNYKFEDTERKDNRFNLDVSRKYFNEYKKETGHSGPINLRFLSGDPTNLNAALGIRSMLNAAFDGDIKIEIKSVPANTYNTLRTKGDFDLTTFNFDQYGTNADSYIGKLFVEDEINSSINKNEGFINNPSGSWTFNEWYKQHQNELNDYEKYFFIDSNTQSDEYRVWEKVKNIIAIDPKSDKQLLLDKLNNIWQALDDVINTSELQCKFVAILEKIIALSSPVVPLLEVDNVWVVSRLYGTDNIYTYNLQFAYDILNKPNPTLPGKEAMISER